jgi:hypothetical protein
MDSQVSTHAFLTMIIDESVCFMSCEPNVFLQLFWCGTHGITFISIFIFHSGIPAKSSNYNYWGTIQGNCVSAHRDEKTCKVAVESNFWKHVLSVKVSSSICSHSLSNKKRWTEDYMLGTWEWPQCYFDNNLLRQGFLLH